MGSFTAGAGTSYLLTSTQPVPTGTANGVLYLNGSKVVTSGSALTFDGTNLSTTGSVTSTNATTGFVTNASNGFALFSGDPLNYNISRSATTVSVKSGGPLVLNSGLGSPIIFNAFGSEQMRLTSTGLGIGTASPSAPLQFGKAVYGAPSDENFYRIKFSDAGGTANDAGIGQPAAGAMGFNVSDSTGYYQWNRGSAGELMRLDLSGNLGIGTSSPSVKLEVAAGAGFPTAKFTRVGTTAQTGAASIGMSQIGFAGSTNADTLLRSDYGFGLQVNSASSPLTAMAVDLSGNIGLGVTPSAWVSTRKALQIGQSGVLAGSTNSQVLDLVSNAIVNSAGNTVYLVNGFASYYRQFDSVHTWAIAASGTAGAATSFTQAMTLDASGNLGIGTTSPGRKLHIVSNGPLRMGQASDYFDFIQSNTNLWSWNSNLGALCMQMNGATGAVVISGLLNTTATDGFLYVPTCAGTPTGTPNTYTGRAPIVVDTTNNKLYFYSGGQWRDAGP